MIFLSILFWVFFATYVIHLLDETILNGGFVHWIRENFWPTYNARMFFWFNAVALGFIAASNVFFDTLGGHWVILPLLWGAGSVTHTFTGHLYWTIRPEHLFTGPGFEHTLSRHFLSHDQIWSPRRSHKRFGFCNRHNNRRPDRWSLPHSRTDVALPEDHAVLASQGLVASAGGRLRTDSQRARLTAIAE